MIKSYAILPCNGLDKCAGCVSKELALSLVEQSESELICPVLYRIAESRYTKIAETKPLLVIDGCATRCASKLASEKNLKIAEKINITDEAKAFGIVLGNRLRIGDNEFNLVKMIIDKLPISDTGDATKGSLMDFPIKVTYEIYKKDKYIFRIPKDVGFYFNENDVWVYIKGNKARIGVTDYAQKNLSDIIYFTPPTLGNKIEQFDEVGSLESGKAVFEIVSPVSGIITAINEKLLDSPELINQNPYEQGWIVELELTDFDDNKELLSTFVDHFKWLKRKVDEFHV